MRQNRLHDYFLMKPSLRDRYRKIKKHANHLVISGYDITNRCNLRCKGCYFFEGDRSSRFSDDRTLEEFDEFFASEVERGVTMPHFAGAEPAKVPERLALAAKYWNRGIVYTNGTIPIAKDLPFMLHISLWGTVETDARLRGKHAFKKALENFSQDSRAIFIFTINHQNIGEMAEVTDICDQHGVRLSFNHYSPTRWHGSAGADIPKEIRSMGKGRFSSPDDNLFLRDEDFDIIKVTIDKLLARYSGALIYSKYYNELINSPDVLFDIDAQTGVASNCTILNSNHHREYRTDLTWDDADCCIPNTDCATCRHYVSNYSKIMADFRRHLESISSFENWLDVYDTWCRINIRNWDDLC